MRRSGRREQPRALTHKTGFARRSHCAWATINSRRRLHGDRSGFGSPTKNACCCLAISTARCWKLSYPPIIFLARKSSNIAETELDALLPLPTKSRPPALTSPEPTQRFLAVVGSTRRALNIVCRLYRCIGVDMPVIVPEEFPVRETFEKFPFLVTVPLVSVEPEYWP